MHTPSGDVVAAQSRYRQYAAADQATYFAARCDAIRKRGLMRRPSVRPCVCVSVCLSRSWILSKRVIVSSQFYHHRVYLSHSSFFFRTKRHGNTPTRTPLTGASNAGRVGTNGDCRSWYTWLSMDDVLHLSTSATIHRAVYHTYGDASVKLYLSQLAACSTSTK